LQLRPRPYCQPSSKVSAEIFSKVDVDTEVGGITEPEFEVGFRTRAKAFGNVSGKVDDCSGISSSDAATASAPLIVAVSGPDVDFFLQSLESHRSLPLSEFLRKTGHVPPA